MSALESVGTDLTTACTLHAAGTNTFACELSADWTVGDKPHGGYLLALLAKAGVAALPDERDPLAVSAEFLRPPTAGPATLHTTVRKLGRTAASVAVELEQDGVARVTGTVTAGVLADEEPAWQRAPEFPAEPEPGALDFATDLKGPSKVASLMGTKLARHNASIFTEHRPGDPLELRGWVRAPDERPDVFFALVAGDVLPPLSFNLGRLGWAPTVQLTALVRARPAPGWLRVQTEAHSVAGDWFDSDATVFDSRGRLVCQARQLALLPRSG